ncbi:M48 family metallopeptidase [Magnetococcus sp. PR-3]|uniref:M48 family metallopeptidase n=1 Tax=Magnetococcus sp. PR-3 TaxID=3120355 RepID=UPI002FCDF478
MVKPLRLSLLLVVALLHGCASTDNPQVVADAFQHAGQVKGSDPIHIPLVKTEGGADKGIDAYQIANLKPDEKPARDTMEGGLWMAVEKVEASYKTSGKIINHDALNQYVQGISCRLAGRYCANARVYLMRVPHLNATMMPNGAMQVWSGLLLRARNEAQLAAVIGHELGHYLRRHSLQRMKSTIDTSNGMMVLTLAMAYGGVGNYSSVVSLIGNSSLAAYGRDHEREADGYGLRLMIESGYDPREAHKIWENVLKEQKADKENRVHFSIYNSHPPSAERQHSLEKLATDYTRTHRAGEVGTERYVRMLQPHIMDFIRDEIDLGNFDRSTQLFESMAEDDFFKKQASYAQGELLRLRGEKGDYEKALALYRKSIADDTEFSEAHLGLGMVLRRLKRHDEAKLAYRTYLRQRPEADGATFIQRYLGTPK